MCILLWTTACANKGYPLILLSNRDEFLQRPTQTAGPWDKNTYGGRDLARPENGTWLGITRCGRFAGLTNIRETTSIAAVGTASRGAVVSSFLTSSDSTFQSLMGSRTQGSSANLDIDQVGGFSMLCGQLSRDQQNRVHIDSFGVISNRVEGQIHDGNYEIIDPAKPGTYGLSNSAFTNPWPKVVNGKSLLNDLVEDIQHDRLTEREIAQKGIDILTSDSVSEDEAWKDMRNRLDLLKQSVFIPMFDTNSLVGTIGQDHALSGIYNFYGTQKQTVIIVHESGAVRYIEKTLYDWLQGATDGGGDTVDVLFNLDL
ncbi:hypothetical protein TWF506_005660 [Arthrobotrys conoides]|uniref:DUF833-domain-containing protein n=1 Tax=Arthrobotrys conoides TaxID=74498 RepID=A0AAN8RW56_9PEZI